MASKAFADANLLLDFTLKRTGLKIAQDVIQLSIDRTVQLCTTPAVVHIISYFTSQAYSKSDTKKLILTLLNDVEIIDCDHTTCITALGSGIDDAEDALQYFTALSHGIDYFISADKKLKRAALPQLPVYAPAEFLKLFAA